MEKLSINKLGKKLLLPVLAGLAMQSAVAGTTPKKNPTPAEKQKIVLECNNKIANFNEASSLITLNKIIGSDLNAMTQYDKLEAKVQNEVVGLLTDDANDFFALSEAYKANEQRALYSTNLSTDQISEIGRKHGEGSSVEEMYEVANQQFAHKAHLGLKTKGLVNFAADEAKFANADEQDHVNEFCKFNVKGKRDVRNESTAVMSILKDNLTKLDKDDTNYTKFAYDALERINSKKTGKSIDQNIGTQNAIKLKQDLDALNVLLSKKGKLSQQDYQKAMLYINDAGEILHKATIFGTKSMCMALIISFAKTYSLNNLLNHLASLNYDISKFTAGNFVKEDNKGFSLTNSVTGVATNKFIGGNIGLVANLPINRNWDLKLIPEVGKYFGINDGPDRFQLMGTAETGYTTKKGNRFGAGLKAGAQKDKDGWSVPFGITANYTQKYNDNLSVIWGINDMLNLSRQTNDLIASASVIIRGKVNVILTIAGGRTYIKNNSMTRSNSSTITPIPDPDPTPTPEPTPTQPTNTTGSDEVIKPQDTTVDKGNMEDIPQKPVDDYSKYY